MQGTGWRVPYMDDTEYRFPGWDRVQTRLHGWQRDLLIWKDQCEE